MLSTYAVVYQRIKASPGIPWGPNSTLSFWTVPPSPIAKHTAETFITHADIVVIGSGITGTSFVRAALHYAGERPLKIVMLEARDACSGATGRNGGHINPPLYADYGDLKAKYGEKEAKTIIKFRISHLNEMKIVAKDEEISKVSQVRDVESLDVYLDQELFDEATRDLQVWKKDMPFESQECHLYEKQDPIERFHLTNSVVGCISNVAGAMHPYRFVTSLLERLLRRHPDNFHLFTNTPCTEISPPTSSTPYYTILTPRGSLTTPHVVHATNGWASHLLEPMRAKIIPVRGNMTAQRPGQSLEPSTKNGNRSWVFFSPGGYDYLTQLPDGEHELMFGGGFAQANKNALLEVGNVNDGEYNFGTMNYISGVLPLLFGPSNWGAEKVPSPDLPSTQWDRGRVKAMWSGILGVSADYMPWVGRVPVKMTARPQPPHVSTPKAGKIESGAPITSPPGEWIAAGYTGEGMVNAWMCGKALAYMVLDVEEQNKVSDWLPETYRISQRRWRNANVESLLERFK
ncbi:hypothetical protein JAAARDRAFT_135046 [Jaapia argillacea MUCL 33604]|uniref:FAD dependent oxidoreductase domain-containing protein n=1 Tax=Jaapia argillacea MUCL 33604 TaxID=933084 RepID=A0A067PUR5_9AGAM|nr:hypothetical protein JAAARDRAFT_135046 [Jaapia argillacea MUCL 33604]